MLDEIIVGGHLGYYYGTYGVRFGAQFQRVDMVISDGH